jgi:hypothetical protein
MTLPDHAAPFKRAKRRWLFIPYAVVVIAVFLWSIAWLEIRNQVALSMDRASVQARAHGIALDWKTRTIGGYPFRVEVALTGFNAAEPSGWSLAAPSLKAVANAYDPGHWVVAAEDGVTLNRPNAGATHITGRAIRASWVGPSSLGGGDAAPRVIVEGLGLTFAADPGAKPFPLASANHAEIFTRTEPDGRMDAGLLLEDAQPRASGPGAPSLLADLTANRPFALLWQGIVSHPKDFHGPSMPSAAQAWANAGGDITTVRAGMSSGPRGLGIRPGVLSLSADGRLRGQADFVIRGDASNAMRAVGQDHIVDPMAADTVALILQAEESAGWRTEIPLTFQAGVTTLGPVAIGPAPKPF